MSTVNKMMNSSYDSGTLNSSTSKKLSTLQSELSSVSSSTKLSDTQKKEKLDRINKEISAIQTASASISTAESSFSPSLMTSMLGSGGGASTDLVNAIFSSSATLANIKTLYSASGDIKNQARTLASEIAVDKARGVDTTDKQKKLTNLTSNVSIVDKSLKSKVNTALETADPNDKETISVIDGIKKSLEAGEKTAKAKAAEDIKEITGEYPKTEETEKTE